MPDFDKMQAWCEEARKLMNFGSREKKRLTKRNEEIAKLLKEGEQFAKQIPNYYGLAFQYKVLAQQAHHLAQNDGTDEEAKQLSNDLRSLKLKVRVAIAQQNPDASPKVRKDALEMARHKPVYEEELRRAEIGLEELKAAPGAETQIKQLTQLIKDAKALIPEYDRAKAKLTGAPALVNEGKQKIAQFPTTAGTPKFRTALSEANTALTNYRNLCVMSNPGAVSDNQKKIDEIVKSIAKPTPDVDDAIDKLEKITTQLKNDSQKASDAKEDAIKLLNEAAPLLNKVIECVPVSEVGSLNNDYLTARAKITGQQFTDAVTDLTTLKGGATTLLTTYEQPAKDWKLLDEDLKKNAEKTLAEAMKIPLLQSTANRMTTSLADARKLAAENRNAEAIKMAKHVVVRNLSELEAQVENWNKNKTIDPEAFTKSTTTRRGARVAVAGNAVHAAEQALDTQLKALYEKGGDRSAFDKEREQVLAVWKKWVTDYSNPDTKDEDREKLMKNIATFRDNAVNGLKAIEVKAKKVADTPSDLENSKSDRAKVEKEQAFLKSFADAQKKLDFLEEFGMADNHDVMSANPSISTIRGQRTTIKDEIAQNVFMDGKLEMLLSNLDTKKRFVEDAIDKTRKAALQTADEISKLIDELQKEHKSYEAFYNQLRQEVNAGRAKAQSTLMAAVELGKLDLEALRTRVKKLEIDEGFANNNDKVPAFTAVERRLKALQKRADTKDMKAYHPGEHKMLEHRLEKEFPRALKSMSPVDAQKKLDEFEKDIAALEGRIEQAEKDRETLDQRVKQITEAAAFLNKENTKTLFNSLKERIQTAKNASKGDEARALADLNLVGILITNAGNPKNAADLERKTKADIFAADRAKEEYKAAKEIWEKTTENEVKTVKDKIDEEDLNRDIYDQVKTFIAQSEKMAKAEDYVQANDQLTRAREMAAYFIQNPYNQAVGARKELPALNLNWGRAVVKFSKDVMELQKVIKAAPGVTPGTEAKLAPLLTLFDATLLTSSAEKMKDSKNRLEIRSEKERALAFLRRYQTALNNDPLVKHVVGNPFHNVAVSGLETSLRALMSAYLAA